VLQQNIQTPLMCTGVSAIDGVTPGKLLICHEHRRAAFPHSSTALDPRLVGLRELSDHAAAPGIRPELRCSRAVREIA